MSEDIRAVLTGERPWTIATGDALALLRGMPDACLHACATSPPYFALRDYQIAGQLGLEETPEQFIANLVDVFREVRRVLMPFGVCWVNMGDSFAGGGGGNYSTSAKQTGHGQHLTNVRNRESWLDKAGYKPLDLLGIPFRLVEALRQDGWYHRDTVVWVKSAPMPQSVAGWRWERCRVKVKSKDTAHMNDSRGPNGAAMRPHSNATMLTETTWQDCPGCPKCEPNDGYVLRKGAWRMTSSWEPVFMLTPSPVYFCDQDAVRTPPAEATLSRDKYSRITATAEEEQYAARHDHETTCDPSGANPRNVLRLGPNPASFGLCRVCGEYHRNVNALKKRNGKPRCPCGAQDFVAHYAAFPSSLVDPLLRASTSAEGCCPTCLTPWARVVERETTGVDNNPYSAETNGRAIKGNKCGLAGKGWAALHQNDRTLGWRPSCSCAAGPPIPMTILDPFAGTGTTILVARRLGLRAIGLDLSPDYSSLARARVLDECPLFGG